MKWYLKISTHNGTLEFPYNGYKTKHEAKKQKELALKEPQNLLVQIIKK